MMKRIKLILLLLISLNFTVYPQYTSNSFFLESNTLRHQWNPSFHGTDLFYFALPYVGDLQLNIGTNAYSMSDIIPNDWRNRGNLFLGPLQSKTQFYNLLQSNDLIAEGNYKINYLDLGIKWKNYFLTFSVKDRLNSQLIVPNSLEKFVLIGNGFDEEMFDFSNLNFDITHYTETSLGISGVLKKLKWGGNLKLLSGLNNFNLKNNDFKLKTSIDAWELNGKGQINSTFPAGSVKYIVVDSINSYYQYQTGTYIHPFGGGLALDLGVSTEILPNLEISAALLDWGYIRWKKNVFNVAYNTEYLYDGIGNINLLFDDIASTFESKLNETIDEIPNAYTLDTTRTAYTTSLTPRFNVGMVYYMNNHKFSAGILYERWKVGDYPRVKTTFALTFVPYQWLNIATSYSNYNNNLNLLGLGVDVYYKNFNLMLTTDYFLPKKYFTYDYNPDGTLPFTVVSIPYETNQLNLAVSLTYVISEKKKPQVCNCYTRDF